MLRMKHLTTSVKVHIVVCYVMHDRSSHLVKASDSSISWITSARLNIVSVILQLHFRRINTSKSTCIILVVMAINKTIDIVGVFFLLISHCSETAERENALALLGHRNQVLLVIEVEELWVLLVAVHK